MESTSLGGPLPAVAGSPAFQTSWHCAFVEARGEDMAIIHGSSDFSSGVALYAVADGHNGSSAARHVSAALPTELERQLGGGPAAQSDAAVRQALARAFVAVDDAVCRQLMQSGCTLTAAVVCGDVLTIANVGDSRAILDTGSEVVELTTDHRIGSSPAEFARLEQAGGRLSRLNDWGSGPSTGTHDGVGPVRLWPGGICVGRAIGDRDVGSILLAKPHIQQVKLPPTGARLILASDGLWDCMPAGRVVRVLRSHGTAKAAAMQAVSSAAALRSGLLSDDVTVVVVDLLPAGTANFKAVCSQFQGRMKAVLSTPSLSSLVEQPEAAAPASPPRRRAGLLACFGRPAVLDEPKPPGQPDHSARSGQNISARGGSLRGGTERSLRGGVVRDPSVRGCRAAASVELLYHGDTAQWSPAQFGRRPSTSCRSAAPTGAPCSRASSDSVQRTSPTGTLDALAALTGLSVSSLSSNDDDSYSHSHRSSQELARTVSLGLAKPLHTHIPLLSRKNSAPPLGEKKCHGGSAAAAMLYHP